MNGFNRRTSTRSAAVLSTLAALAGASMGLLSVAAPAAAQAGNVAAVTAYFAVVDKDGAVFRPAGNDIIYPIMPLARGTVLRVDGETTDAKGQAWSRASYPLGSFVFVPADAVTLDPGGKTGSLSKLARAKAPNKDSGYKGSWSDALPQALGAGTKVTILENEPATGTAVAYKIAPPEGARGFVLGSLLRRASQDEINAFMARAGAGVQPIAAGAQPPAPAATPVTTAAPTNTPATTPSTTTSTPTEKPTTDATAANSTGATGTPGSTSAAPSGGNLTQPMVIPQGTQAQPVPAMTPAATPASKPTSDAPAGNSPETFKPSQDAPSTTPAAGTTSQPAGGNAPATGTTPDATPREARGGGTQPAAIEARPVPPKAPANPYEKLEGALSELRKQPVETAEYTELAAQFQAELDKLDDSPASQAVRPRLQQRLTWLKSMADLQALRRKVAEDAKAATSSRSTIDERLADVARNRQYSVVGRLTASAIYDGTRLPLMYRIQAAGTGSPRTLAYLRPDAKLKIDSKIGQVIGVIGTTAIDSSLNLNIITPTRIDVLEAAPTQPAAPQPAATPAAGAPAGS